MLNIAARPRVEVVRVAELKPAPYNPRAISDASMAALEKSLERFGVVEPIIWNRTTGHVVGGHQRLKILRANKVTETLAVVVELDDVDEKALNVALNSPKLAGEFTARLHQLLDEIEAQRRLRRGEVFGLKWGDIDLEGAVLSVRRALAESGKMKATKTKRSQRRVNLPRSIVEELRAHRDRMAAEKLEMCELVFPSRCGMPMEPRSLYYQHFLPAMKRAGLRRIRFHDLRHTAATIRLAAGDNPKVVQEMLGHTKIETTLGVYGHVVPSMQEDSAALYDRLMSLDSYQANGFEDHTLGGRD